MYVYMHLAGHAASLLLVFGPGGYHSTDPMAGSHQLFP